MKTRYIERFVLIFLLFAGLSNSIARAGDYASREILGFSPDGQYFAFEQYGVQAGSGFPYSEIFVIDTSEDKWVEGTPIRERIDNESAAQREVRDQSMERASRVLSDLDISRPGDLLASNPRSELSADPYRVVVNRMHRFSPPKEVPVTFTLSETELPPRDCAQYTDQPIKGFNLTMRLEEAEPIKLHDEKSVPTSRGCTLGYAIADVVNYEQNDKTSWVVLLHVTTVGFEGPNSRFLAVTRRLP